MVGLRPYDHFSDAVEILACDCKGFIDAVDGASVGEERRKPVEMEPEKFEGGMRFVVRPADIEDGQFLAAHCRAVERDEGRGMNAGESDATCVSRKQDSLIAGVFSGGTVDCTVHAALSCVAEDLSGC